MQGRIARINRNIVECKDVSNWRAIVQSSSINRNIVECKDSFKHILSNPQHGINRNIVECKVRYRSASPLALPVLIETLWNVK